MRFSIQKSISNRSLFHNYLFAFLLGFGFLDGKTHFSTTGTTIPSSCRSILSQTMQFAAAVLAGTGTPIWVQTSSGHMPFIS